MKKPKISLVFPAYQRPDDVRETLQHIRNNVSIPYEVFILDNSLEVDHILTKSNEHYIHTGFNAGSTARNLGIQLSTAPYCLMLDDDSHPLPGSVEAVVEYLDNSEASVAGFTGVINRLDGSGESSLLPTVFHGCGFALKANIFRENKLAYPKEFCFYGEEYHLTLQLYSKGFKLEHCPEMNICHRSSPEQRSKEKIFYYLARNNQAIWQNFIPLKFRNSVFKDSLKRYELIAQKENVWQDFNKGFSEALILKNSTQYFELTHEQFFRFSCLSSFKKSLHTIQKAEKIILCGTGKFPNLWADYLQENGVKNILIADFNSGLADKKFNQRFILNAQDVFQHIKNGYHCIVGHSSFNDTKHWLTFLEENFISSQKIIHLQENSTHQQRHPQPVAS